MAMSDIWLQFQTPSAYFRKPSNVTLGVATTIPCDNRVGKFAFMAFSLKLVAESIYFILYSIIVLFSEGSTFGWAEMQTF